MLIIVRQVVFQFRDPDVANNRDTEVPDQTEK